MDAWRIQPMMLRLILAMLLLLATTVLQAQCVPGPNYHCVATTPCGPGVTTFAYIPNLLTVVEGDTVEFQANSCHPLRQVVGPNPNTSPVPGGLACASEPCIQVMGAAQMPVFHFLCTNHITAVMRGDITILPRSIFAGGFEG
jgi:plastocyanin